eukprot:Gregarina_sp_Pseudo_9__848@NODE_1543_length_1509_cov_12_289116_g1430_i0_p1_GENE_NODE_1543_length_1509_cov_12_289116_g1430_i0NODE_1543_length_1509_cov_12_289116_g1430_i0_p1_ORF_typecomplete_len365_score75_82_NODE_1543_length_1509_cov_12_289116_g1430_i02241318
MSTMTESASRGTCGGGDEGPSPPVDTELDAMILLDQFLAKISPAEAPALMARALAKRQEEAALVEVEAETASLLTTQEPSAQPSSGLQAQPSSETEDATEPAAAGASSVAEETASPAGSEDVTSGALRDLHDSGLLEGIPMRATDSAVRSELSKLSNQALSPLTTTLLKRGYDIRLGEKGRSDLKQEISRKTRSTPELKDICAQIARLKQANIFQLIQLAEVCGSLEKALKISQQYWRDSSRKSRQPSRSHSGRKSNASNSPASDDSPQVKDEEVADGVAAPTGVTIKTSAHCQGEMLTKTESSSAEDPLAETETAGSESGGVAVVVVKPSSAGARSSKRRRDSRRPSASASPLSDGRKQSRLE